MVQNGGQNFSLNVAQNPDFSLNLTPADFGRDMMSEKYLCFQ